MRYFVLLLVIVATAQARAQAQPLDLGQRPAELIEQLEPGPLKTQLAACADKPAVRSDFSIGHRGAPLHYPEHTKEGYEAAARMGAGVVECDVTFTHDRQLVCRHAQCDLHTTTNILLVPELAAKCSQPFVPADRERGTAASARCCTSDLTVAEFKRLRGKKDGFNAQATTVAEYVKDAAETGTVMTHAESIELFKRLGVGMAPELKAPAVDMPFKGFTREAFAQQIIDEYKAAGVPPQKVWLQAFDIRDVHYWLDKEPTFARQAVALQMLRNPADLPSATEALPAMKARGVRIVAPPTWALVTRDSKGRIVASDYARALREQGFQIITWTLERSGDLRNGGGFYFQSLKPPVKNASGYFELLDALAQEVGVKAVFSDWAATTSYYAGCMSK
jgi:glycerophosphoryl diester phosphodiesterase